MKKWILGGMAALALPIMAQADSPQGTVQGHRNATGGVCSDGGTCCAPCAQPCKDNCCFSSCCPKCCGTWELEGQALYWRLCADDELYGVNAEGSNPVVQDLLTVHPDNEWGFRIKGQYTSCDGCKFASLSYLYFDETDQASAAPVSQTSYFGSNALFEAVKIHAEYQRLDGRLGHYVCKGCNGGFYGYGGISWIYILENQRLDGAISGGAEGFVTQRNRYSAAGFEAGIGGHYKICGGFGLAASFGGIAAIGERQVSFLYLQEGSTPLGIQNNRPNLTICIPGMEVKLEAFYECCWCGFNWGLMLGYENQHYWNPKQFTSLYFLASNQPGTSTFAQYKDFGVGGLYFGAKVGY